MRMMVVVPALAKSEQGYPPTVARVFTGVEAFLAPHMSGRVHQPRRVEPERHPHKDSPEQDTPTAEGEHQDGKNDQWHVIETVEQNIESIFDQVGRISLEGRLIMILCSAAQDPTHVRPPAAIARCMWIAVSIRMRMMNAMCSDPLNRSAFEGQRSTDNQKIFDWLWYAIPAMSEEPMKAHPYAAATNPIENYSADERRPAKEK